jgi:hypothetical protein
MDIMQCPLEQASYDQAGDFLTSLGWGPGRHLLHAPVDRLQELEGKNEQFTDNVWSNLSIIPHMPSAYIHHNLCLADSGTISVYGGLKWMI